MNSSKARVVMQKPGGTGTPAVVRAPRLAPLPPTIDVSPAWTSAKNRVSGRSSPLLVFEALRFADPLDFERKRIDRALEIVDAFIGDLRHRTSAR